MKRAERGLPTCHPRSLVVKPALAEQQHKCPICVCLPVDAPGWVLDQARKLCLFYRPWQLTGYWEQRPNDTATQQISTSSASCSFGQIWSLPPLKHNGVATAKQPPARRAPTLPHRKTSWSTLSLGHSCIKGDLPQSPGPPRPQLARCVYFRWANIATCLRVQWPALSGGLRIAPACFAGGYMWPHTATSP